jgi:methenyltetrahydrofolate cyclohydrolase
VAPPQRHLDLTLEQWLAELSAARPAPASGSMLAYAVASAAALLVKAARISADAGGVAAQASALLERAAALVQLDADVYERALSARAAASELTPERQDWEVGRAYAAAAEPPLEIARIAADVAELGAALVAGVDARVQADATAAAMLAAGAARGAVALVAVNLTATHDDPRIAEAERLARAAEDAARRTVT